MYTRSTPVPYEYVSMAFVSKLLGKRTDCSAHVLMYVMIMIVITYSFICILLCMCALIVPGVSYSGTREIRSEVPPRASYKRRRVEKAEPAVEDTPEVWFDGVNPEDIAATRGACGLESCFNIIMLMVCDIHHELR